MKWFKKQSGSSFGYFFEPLTPTFLEDALDFAQRKSKEFRERYTQHRIKIRSIRFERAMAKLAEKDAAERLQKKQEDSHKNEIEAVIRTLYQATSVRIPLFGEEGDFVFTTKEGHEATISLSSEDAWRDLRNSSIFKKLYEAHASEGFGVGPTSAAKGKNSSRSRKKPIPQ